MPDRDAAALPDHARRDESARTALRLRLRIVRLVGLTGGLAVVELLLIPLAAILRGGGDRSGAVATGWLAGILGAVLLVSVAVLIGTLSVAVVRLLDQESAGSSAAVGPEKSSGPGPLSGTGRPPGRDGDPECFRGPATESKGGAVAGVVESRTNSGKDSV